MVWVWCITNGEGIINYFVCLLTKIIAYVVYKTAVLYRDKPVILKGGVQSDTHMSMKVPTRIMSETIVMQLLP